MKQVISIADFATILNLLNERIDEIEKQIAFNTPYNINDKEGDFLKRQKAALKQSNYYQSLIHAKKALEECKVEIEVPDLEVGK